MFEIELKFNHKNWKNYFGKQFHKREAFDLFSKLVVSFYDCEWRMVYKPLELLEDK